MLIPYIHPDDRSRLRRWATQQATLCTLVFLVAILAGTFSRPPGYALQDNQDANIKSPALVEPQYAHFPHGWRRTINGWEHTSQWHSAPRFSETAETKSIDGWVKTQTDREPRWIQMVLDAVRSLPPLTFAILQIAAVTVAVTITSPQKNADEDCKV